MANPVADALRGAGVMPNPSGQGQDYQVRDEGYFGPSQQYGSGTEQDYSRNEDLWATVQEAMAPVERLTAAPTPPPVVGGGGGGAAPVFGGDLGNGGYGLGGIGGSGGLYDFASDFADFGGTDFGSLPAFGGYPSAGATPGSSVDVGGGFNLGDFIKAGAEGAMPSSERNLGGIAKNVGEFLLNPGGKVVGGLAGAGKGIGSELVNWLSGSGDGTIDMGNANFNPATDSGTGFTPLALEELFGITDLGQLEGVGGLFGGGGFTSGRLGGDFGMNLNFGNLADMSNLGGVVEFRNPPGLGAGGM